MNLHLATTAAAIAVTAACGFDPAGAPVPLVDRLADRAQLAVTTASDLDATAVAVMIIAVPSMWAARSSCAPPPTATSWSRT